jgi:ABC-2 type transport system permease protein
MTTTLRAHLLALRTVRSTTVMILAVLAVVALITRLDLAGIAGTAYRTPAQLRDPLFTAAGLISGSVLAMFTAAKVAGEYRHGTLTLRLLAAPRRLRLLAATLLGYAGLAAATAVAALAIGTAIALPIVAGKGLALDLTAPMFLGAVLAVVLLALLGAAVGVICRSQAAALSVLVGWFFTEQLLAGVIGGAAAYLPFALLSPLLGLQGAVLPRATAALALTAITVGVTTLAAMLFTRRDVA